MNIGLAGVPGNGVIDTNSNITFGSGGVPGGLYVAQGGNYSLYGNSNGTLTGNACVASGNLQLNYNVAGQNTNELGNTAGTGIFVGSGGTLSLNGIGASSIAPWVIGKPITLDGNGASAGLRLARDLAGNIIITNTVTLANATNNPVGILVTTATDLLTITGPITGSNSGLNKLGAGALLLSGTNTYADGTTITAGNLRLGGTSERLAAIARCTTWATWTCTATTSR